MRSEENNRREHKLRERNGEKVGKRGTKGEES